MPALTDAGAPPSVPLSFSNNFWGKSDLGVDPLLTRMQNAKTTNDELRAFYKARAELEEEYSKKLFAISRKPLGSVELGTLRASLDVARGETEAMGKQHALIAQQMKTECEEPLGAFAAGIKERKKIVQTGIDRLLKTKQAQTMHVNKCRDKYEQDCLRVKGYLAQGHMVMGQEERKNKAKLERTQINMASNSQEYETAVKVLEETTGRWNKEWKAACDKFQDLEEERLDFTKSSLWAFANIASTVCVSDDSSCEKIRLALENCEVEKDIVNFIRTCGTGQEIPDPPRYINFAKGDSDTASEVSEDENAYSVAQFQRTTNPAFRTSSPTYEKRESNGSRQLSEEPQEPVSGIKTAGPNSGRPPPLNYRQPDPHLPPNYSPSQHGDIAPVPHNQYPTEGMTMYCRRDDQPSRAAHSDLSASTRPPSRDSQSDYSNPSSFTSAEPTSGKASPVKQHPVNGVGLPGMTPNASPDKSIQKKRSGFFSKSPFSANSPFRRKSKKEAEHPSQSDGWTPGSSRNTGSISSTHTSPTRQQHMRQSQPSFNRNAGISAPEGEEPADPRANFQLNIGPNVLDVASPDHNTSHESTPRASVNANTRRGPFSSSNVANGDDPIAQALANLKQSSGGLDMSKRASLRQPVDAYHRLKTPAPDQKPAQRPHLMSAHSQDVLAAQRGTPPPSYDGNGSRGRTQSALGVPEPAFTSKEMRSRTENWGMGSSVSAPVGRPPSSMGMSRPASRDGRRSPAVGGPGMIPRAVSPQPQHPGMRARSPGPGHSGQMRARSPAPGQQGQMRSRSPAPGMPPQGQGGSGRSRQGMMNGRPQSSYGSHHDSGFTDQRGRGVDPHLRRERSKSIAAPGMMQGQGQYRSASPNPYAGTRPGTQHGSTGSRNMEMQLASSDVARYDGGGGSNRGASGVCFMARAMYSYNAAIPEELSFNKGDLLGVLRLQDDGWWEAEVQRSVKTGQPGNGAVGLVPSNYLQRC